MGEQFPAFACPSRFQANTLSRQEGYLGADARPEKIRGYRYRYAGLTAFPMEITY